MKGELTIKNEVKPLKLMDFSGEAFLFEDNIHLMLYQPEHLTRCKGIPCFNVNIPGIVFLKHIAEIQPIDVEIIAT